MVWLLLSLFTSGCWDRVEIEERGFVIGIAIDVPQKEDVEEKQEEEAPGKPKGKIRFVVTYQMVIPEILGGGGVSQKSGGTEEAFFNVSSEGDTMDTITRDLVTRTSRTPFFQHLQMIIVSEDVAKSEFGFANSTDFFLRNQEMRRNIKILISKGNARKVLEAVPPNEKLPVMYIKSVSENKRKSARMLPETRIGDMQGHLLRSESFVVQRIAGRDKEVKIAGCAVFQGNKNNMIGFLGEEETEGLNFITGNIQGGVLEFQVYDNLVVFEIENMKRHIKVNVKDKNRLRFTITIETEGMIGESFERMDFQKSTTLSNLEKKLAEEIKRLTNDTIEKVHKEFKKDVLGLGTYLKQEHYDTWKLVKDDWDSGRNYFAKSQVEVEAKVQINSMGIIYKAETRGK